MSSILYSFQILTSFLDFGLDSEDVQLMHELFNLVRDCDSLSSEQLLSSVVSITRIRHPNKLLDLIKSTAWVDHPASLVPDPIDVETYIDLNGQLHRDRYGAGLGSRKRHCGRPCNRLSKRTKFDLIHQGLSEHNSSMSDHLSAEESIPDSPMCEPDTLMISMKSNTPQKRRLYDQVYALEQRRLAALSRNGNFNSRNKRRRKSSADEIDLHLGPAVASPPINSTGRCSFVCYCLVIKFYVAFYFLNSVFTTSTLFNLI